MNDITIEKIKKCLSSIKNLEYVFDIFSGTFEVTYGDRTFKISKESNSWAISYNKNGFFKEIAQNMPRLVAIIESIINDTNSVINKKITTVFQLAKDYGFNIIPIDDNINHVILRLEGSSDYNDIVLNSPYLGAWIIECKFMDLVTKPIRDLMVIGGFLNVIKYNILSPKLPTGLSDMKEITNPKYVSIPVSKIELELDAYEYDYKIENLDSSIAITATYSDDVKLGIIRNEVNNWTLAEHRTDGSITIYDLDTIDDVREILSDIKSSSDWNRPSVVKEEPFSSLPDGSINMDFKQTGKLETDFVNDYKLMKSIERSVNDNLKVITDAFYKYTKVDMPATIIADDNNKVFFFVENENSLELNFEFFIGGDLYSYSYTNRGIRLLDDYNKKAVIALANLIERTVKTWLNKFSSKEDFIEVSDRVLSSVENIKVMIGLMARTIDIYNH